MNQGLIKVILNFYLIILISITSCKKKAEEINPNRIDLITNGTIKVWILTEITSNGKSVIENCAKDDEYTFEKASNLVKYEPQLKCYSNDDANALTYSLNSDGKSIIIDDVLYVINELTSKKMVISHDGKDNARINATETSLHQQQTLTLISK